MVTNAPPEFYAAKKKFEDARTAEEKLEALYEMLKLAPKHKGASNLLKWIKREIKKYKEIIKKSKRGIDRGIKLVEKSGDIMISIIGVENSGKSYFLKKFTNSNVEVSEIPFYTKEPAIGTLFYKGIYYQFVEIPSTFRKAYRTILSSSDFFILILDTRRDIEEQINRVNEFCKGIVEFSLKEDKNYLIILNKYNDFSDIKIEDLLEKIIEKKEYIRVFPINSNHAVLLRKGSKVKDFIEKVNRNFLNGFRYANIIRGSKKIRAGLEFELLDLDIVEIKTKN